MTLTMCEYLMPDIVPLPIDATHVCETLGSRLRAASITAVNKNIS